ncbi:MAG: hypothetical protein ACOYT4_00205 [Nanoarchaeota archaeon]
MIPKFIRNLFLATNLIFCSDSYYINNEYIKLYLEGVKDDLDLLRKAQGMTISERKKYLAGICEDLIKEYSENYCPSTFYKKFSFENQMRYLIYRVEIDQILKTLKPFETDTR